MATSNTYHVWNVLSSRSGIDGETVQAVSSFEARRIYAASHNCSYQDCAARRLHTSESDRRQADRIDGYDRDDLGESPDY